jgi:hypothetical protein
MRQDLQLRDVGVFLLRTLAITVCAAIGSIFFGPMAGRSKVETFVILVFVGFVVTRDWSAHRPSPQDAPGPKSSTNFPTFIKVGRALHSTLPLVRNASIGLLVAAAFAVALWVLITLIRWFWFHPLLR